LEFRRNLCPENFEKSGKSEKFVAFFQSNAWHGNSGIENSILPLPGVFVPFGYALGVFMPFKVWHENGGFFIIKWNIIKIILIRILSESEVPLKLSEI